MYYSNNPYFLYKINFWKTNELSLFLYISSLVLFIAFLWFQVHTKIYNWSIEISLLAILDILPSNKPSTTCTKLLLICSISYSYITVRVGYLGITQVQGIAEEEC